MFTNHQATECFQLLLLANERKDRAAPQVVPRPAPRSSPLPAVWLLAWRKEAGAPVRVMERSEF